VATIKCSLAFVDIKEERYMKNLLSKVNKRTFAKAVLVAVTIMNNSMVCFASADEIANQITTPFTTFLGVMVTIVQVIGGYLLLKAIMDFSTSWKGQDDTGMVNSLKTGVSGLLFVFSRLILGIFGVTL